MRAIVTGAAGFIGSHLVDALLADGHQVVGIDCFTTYYDVAVKASNLDDARLQSSFEFIDTDLRTADLSTLIRPGDVVFHQAGQPGVRMSWSDGFPEYVSLNILVTQRLLEACLTAGIDRMVYASSSSIYGNAERYPTLETDLPAPMSPYGVTKLSAEHLCSLYSATYGLPAVSLRYFTVYGPRQRPDMAIHRLVESALHQYPFALHGDGSKIRDFTFVGDVVRANLLAATSDLPPGTILNIAGGSSTSMSGLIELVTDLAGVAPVIEPGPDAAGDVERTGGSIDRAHELLGWSPTVDLATGISHQVAWHHQRLPLGR